MTQRDDSRDAERLPDEAARRLLARASDLEAARNAELSVAELREAAREAGIAPSAFEQALSELRAQNMAAAAPAGAVSTRPRPLSRFTAGARIAAQIFGTLMAALLVAALLARM
jgi:hypothetical protein